MNEEIADLTHLMPYFMLEILRENGGWIDLDAQSIRDSIESGEEAQLTVYIANGKVILEIDENEGSASQQIGEATDKS